MRDTAGALPAFQGPSRGPARPPFPNAAPTSGPSGRYDGTTKRQYLERLKHRRWAASFPHPRVFGFVERWDDEAGEGVIVDQEKTQKYLVIRDEIGRSWHNHKTLQRAEMVEFFATDEMDEVAKLPLAKNISGAFGRPVKGSQEYRDLMLTGPFPKRFGDNYEDYEEARKVGEYYLQKKWRNAWKA